MAQSLHITWNLLYFKNQSLVLKMISMNELETPLKRLMVDELCENVRRARNIFDFLRIWF